MDKDRNSLDKVQGVTEQYENNPALVENAISRIKAEQANKQQKKKSFFSKHWIKMSAAVAACLIVAVVTPILYAYFNKPDEPVVAYYSTEEISVVEIEDVEAFVAEEQIIIRYFSGPMVRNACGLIKNTGEAVFLHQIVMVMQESSFDSITAYIVFADNVEFEFSEHYKLLSETINVSGINVSYYQEEENQNNVIRVAFEFENNDYYLEITTLSEPTSAVTKYVQQLIN